MELALITVVIKWCNEINRRIQNKWSNLSGIPGEKHIHEPIEPMVIGDAIIAKLSYSGMGAWIAEFGMGSLMEKDIEDNPYLNQYLAGDNFNKWRLWSSRLTVKGRSAGEYKDLDGVSHTSSGKMAGLDLERDGYIKPILPLHIIKQEVEFALPEIEADIQFAVVSAINKIFIGNAKIYI